MDTNDDLPALHDLACLARGDYHCYYGVSSAIVAAIYSSAIF